jgi:hypothetical protein
LVNTLNKIITQYRWLAEHFAVHCEHSIPMFYSSFTHYVLGINCT